MAFLDIQFVGPVVAGLLSLAIGTFTFFGNRKSATHRYFFAVTIVMAVWSLSIAVFHIPGEASSLRWNLHWITGLFLAPTIFLALKNFPASNINISLPVRLFVWLGAGAVAFLGIAFPEKFIQYYVLEAGSIPQVTVGPFVWVYEVYFGVYFISGFAFLVRELTRSYGRVRAQISAGLIGFIVGTAGAAFTNLVLSIHFGIELIWLGPIFGIIGIISFSYMLFGVEAGRTRLFPISMLGFAILAILLFQMLSASTIEALIFNGAILAGICVLIIFLVRDILSERADLRRFQDLSYRLQQANENLKRADRVTSEFLAIVSHHLRTPLTHIKWALTELAAGNYGQPLAPEQQKLTKDLLANNERLVNFIESFMDTSRIEAGKIVLEKKKVNIELMIEELITAIRDHAEHYYRVEIEVMPSTEKIPLVVMDQNSIRRVFASILDNAIIYNKPGGKVYVKTEKSNGNVVVEITDTGIGMAKEDLQEVGQKFFRSAAAKRHAAEGTGLGVFIARHIVQLHRGDLKIHSQAGEGTTVTITLPAA